MNTSLFCTRARRFAFLLMVAAAAPTFATPVTEMRMDDLLAMAPEFKKSLALTPNQQTLWQQVEGKSRALMRERLSRREHLQQAVKQAVDAPGVELRDVANRLDAETDTGAAEEKQMRALWLTMYDALDDKQRQDVATLVAEQLLRVPDSARRPDQGRPKEEGAGGRRNGAGRGRSGGASGL